MSHALWHAVMLWANATCNALYAQEILMAACIKYVNLDWCRLCCNYDGSTLPCLWGKAPFGTCYYFDVLNSVENKPFGFGPAGQRPTANVPAIRVWPSTGRPRSRRACFQSGRGRPPWPLKSQCKKAMAPKTGGGAPARLCIGTFGPAKLVCPIGTLGRPWPGQWAATSFLGGHDPFVFMRTNLQDKRTKSGPVFIVN